MLDSLLIRSVVCSDAEVAYRVLRLIDARGFSCDEGTGLQLLNLSAVSGNAELADFIFVRIVQWEHTLTNDHCLALLQALMRGGQVNRAFEVINQFSQLGITFSMNQLKALANEISYSKGKIHI